MTSFLNLPPHIEPVASAITRALARVNERFDRQLQSEFPPVQRLCQHIERYRGKMLRPMLVLASGLAASPPPRFEDERSEFAARLTPAHITVAAVCEMIHMATLIHDDVLDDAEMRRGGETVNGLHGNETAVILGDYLIAAAYHLCSQLDSQRTALMLGQASMTMCTGELLQLSHRDDLSLDEPTYFEIVERKTAALVALSCHLGAMCSGADEEICRRFERFGLHIGVAFQIHDDLLDITAREGTLGKPVGQDLEKGKLTLPMIHHLTAASPDARGRALTLLEEVCSGAPGGEAASRGAAFPGATDRACANSTPRSLEPSATSPAAQLVALLEQTGSITHARRTAERVIAQAKAQLDPVPCSPARDLMLEMADAVVKRSF